MRLRNLKRYEAHSRRFCGSGAQFHKPLNRDASIFHGAIADTEPDGWARRVILRDRPLTPVDFLLEVDDVNRVGALRSALAEALTTSP